MGLGDFLKAASNIIDAVNKGSDAANKVAETSSKFGLTPTSNEQNSATANSNATGSKYSAELEEMIEMAIENGDISEKEMEILKRRANNEGIDPDEFEFSLRMRIKKQNRQRQEMANLNPVDQLSRSLKMMEQYAEGGEGIVNPSDLSGALSLIPGVGMIASAGAGLLSSFIQTPSNLNELKAEVIRCFALPDNPDQLAQFINYAVSQKSEAKSKKRGFNIKSTLSSITVGSEMDITPIWENKIEEACDKSKAQYPSHQLLMQTVKKYEPSTINKLKDGRIKAGQLDSVVAPSDNNELFEVVEFAFSKRESKRGSGGEFGLGSLDIDNVDISDISGDSAELWKKFHARMYKEAERRFAGNPALLERLKVYKVKKFGLF